MNHLTRTMTRLGIRDLGREEDAKVVLDLLFEEQGMGADANSRPMVDYINIVPWEMYLCLLYVELESYRSASRRDPGLGFGPLEELFDSKNPAIEDLKTVRDKVLHPAKGIELEDALESFMEAGARVDGHYFKLVFDAQRRLDVYCAWLRASLSGLVSLPGMVETPRLQAKRGAWSCGRVRRYRVGAHTKFDLKVHLVWIPKYRKRILVGPVAIRVRDLIRQVAMEHELHIISGKVARDHVHVVLSYRPSRDISTIVQWLKGISSRVLLQEFPHLRKQFWGRHFWARGYLAVSSGSLTDEMVASYIEEQEGEPLHDDGQFPIDSL